MGVTRPRNRAQFVQGLLDFYAGAVQFLIHHVGVDGGGEVFLVEEGVRCYFFVGARDAVVLDECLI